MHIMRLDSGQIEGGAGAQAHAGTGAVPLTRVGAHAQRVHASGPHRAKHIEPRFCVACRSEWAGSSIRWSVLDGCQ